MDLVLQGSSWHSFVFLSTAAISAWSKSRSLGRPTRARQVLDRMLELYHEGRFDLPHPNTICYTAVINCCAYCQNCDDADKQLRDIVSPVFPALAGGGAEIALLRLDRNSGPARDPRTADAIRDRHGSIYRVLLI